MSDVVPFRRRGTATARLAVVTFVMALTLAVCSRAGADNPLPKWNDTMKSDFYRDVLDWCDARGGEFKLHDKNGEPAEYWIDFPLSACEIGLFVPEEIWAGFPGVREIPLMRWWNLKNGFASKGIEGGILWYVPARQGGELCSFASAALNNPAKVPVDLIGPGVGECGLEEGR